METQPEATEVSTESTESTASPAESVQSAPEPDAPAPADQADAPAEKAQRKPRKQQSTARKTRTVELVLTVTGTADGEWQAELTQSGKRVVRGLVVPAAAVSRAAAELHEDISKAIESVLDAAREQHQAKVAELEAELARAKAALAELQEG
nr:DUF6319 family protein [Labedaea rhizosphaerae]